MTLNRYDRWRLRNDWWIYRLQRAYRDLPMTLAWLLPRKIALWAFIRVYACDGQAPGPEYVRVYDAWARGEGK